MYKHEQFRGSLKRSDVHTLFIPAVAKSVNFVCNSCHTQMAMFSRQQKWKYPL